MLYRELSTTNDAEQILKPTKVRQYAQPYPYYLHYFYILSVRAPSQCQGAQLVLERLAECQTTKLYLRGLDSDKTRHNGYYMQTVTFTKVQSVSLIHYMTNCQAYCQRGRGYYLCNIIYQHGYIMHSTNCYKRAQTLAFCVPSYGTTHSTLIPERKSVLQLWGYNLDAIQTTNGTNSLHFVFDTTCSIYSRLIQIQCTIVPQVPDIMFGAWCSSVCCLCHLGTYLFLALIIHYTGYTYRCRNIG